MTPPTVETTEPAEQSPNAPQTNVGDQDGDTSPPLASQRLTQTLRGVHAHLLPPEIWSTPRPSLSQQMAYARHGRWGPLDGPWRWAAIAYFAVVSLPTSAMAYYWEWLWERPTRAAAGLVLVWLGVQTWPGQWVVTVVAAWLGWVIDPIGVIGGDPAWTR